MLSPSHQSFDLFVWKRAFRSESNLILLSSFIFCSHPVLFKRYMRLSESFRSTIILSCCVLIFLRGETNRFPAKQTDLPLPTPGCKGTWHPDVTGVYIRVLLWLTPGCRKEENNWICLITYYLPYHLPIFLCFLPSLSGSKLTGCSFLAVRSFLGFLFPGRLKVYLILGSWL